MATSSDPSRARPMPVGEMPMVVAGTPSRRREIRPAPTTVRIAPDVESSRTRPPTTIRDYLRRLGERGHITRTCNPADGRSYLVERSRELRQALAAARTTAAA